MSNRNLFDLSDMNIVVIGGGGHLCSEIAKGFANFGASVAIADLRHDKAVSVAEDISKVGSKALHYQVDATSKKSIEKLLQEILEDFARVDVLVNGSGINSSKPFLEIPESNWRSVVDSQLTATFFGCQTFGRYFHKNQSGNIINISSASADIPLSRAFAYSAAKAGIRNLTQNLAREWATEGIRVNALRPGFFPTAWNRENFITPEREASILAHTPMKRFGETQELVGAAVFLASRASTFVTGSEIVVDGGFSCMTI